MSNSRIRSAPLTKFRAGAKELAALLTLLAGCSTNPPMQPAGGNGGSSGAISATCPAAPKSPYDINATWETDSGTQLRLADLRGKPRFMAMFFANCQGVCLLTLDHMKELEASLPAEARAKVGFVLVTLDPASDGTDKLAIYRHENALGASTWTILRGGDAATAELAQRLGITFSRQSSRGFVHSSGITLVDADGKILQEQLGNHPDLAEMVKAATNEANKQTVAAYGNAE